MPQRISPATRCNTRIWRNAKLTSSISFARMERRLHVFICVSTGWTGGVQGREILRANHSQDRLEDQRSLYLEKGRPSDLPFCVSSQRPALRRLGLCRISLCFKCLYFCLRFTVRSVTPLFGPFQLSLDLGVKLVDFFLKFGFPVGFGLGVLRL